MGLIANLDGIRNRYKLCFVRKPWAFFTSIPLERQWGDRWEAAPYETYAGDPYRDFSDQILTLAYDGPLFTPDKGIDRIACSALDINTGNAPWLRTESYTGGPPLAIMAGATLETFVQTVGLAGGCVFAPLGWADLANGQCAVPQPPPRAA
ncbi:hypothetical protein [Trinickia dinghuensis]|uniref:Uncharacterized protein n=1 Tax=Trinickia dinghuensis TaxID=2291023 RepID=A0A3D8K2R4_9BURK|nr:hypothetical protein [Trinickia dinghuensis]RDU99342.1 hypothetical protein DWV00_09550 [Trinickia dinghuensis]